MRLLKLLLWNLFFLLVFGGIVFGGAEWYLRSDFDSHRRSVSAVGIPIFESDELNTYRHKPDSQAENGYGDPVPSIRINDVGLRHDQDHPSAINTKNILMIGDSFTFGTGVDQDETFSAILEQRLHEHDPENTYHVWNAGHIGYSVGNYYLLAKKYQDILKPDLIVVNFFVANDITELRRKNWHTLNDDLVQVIDQKVFVNDHHQLDSWTRIKPFSLAWQALCEKVQTLGYRSGWWKEPEKPTLTWPVFLPEDHPGYDPALPEYWERFFAAWTQMEAWSQSNDIPILYTFIPMDVQVSSVYDDKYAIFVFDQEARKADRPQQKLQAFCDEKNLNCLDFLPHFRKDTRPDEIYFQHNADPHFDLWGHQLVGGFLMDKIKEDFSFLLLP